MEITGYESSYNFHQKAYYSVLSVNYDHNTVTFTEAQQDIDYMLRKLKTVIK